MDFPCPGFQVHRNDLRVPEEVAHLLHILHNLVEEHAPAVAGPLWSSRAAIKRRETPESAPVRMHDVDGGGLHQLPSTTCVADVAEKGCIAVGGEGNPS